MGFINTRSRSNSRRRSISFNTINVTPLLDVLIVLLIIFMITAQMSHNVVDLNIPKIASKTSGNIENNELMRVYINAKQEVSVNETHVENLDQYLQLLVNRDMKNQVVVIGDMSVPYQKLVEVLVSLNNSGFTKVKMAYDKK